MTTVKFNNVGRGKQSWWIVTTQDASEIDYDFLFNSIKKHKALMSDNIEFLDDGTITAGFRPVGTFEIIDDKPPERAIKAPYAVYFLIDRQGKIYLHDDLDATEAYSHENIIQLHNLQEQNVCKLIYYPNGNYTDFVGIPEITSSCNLKYDALPFELKKTHLDSIEKMFFDKNSELYKLPCISKFFDEKEIKGE